MLVPLGHAGGRGIAGVKDPPMREREAFPRGEFGTARMLGSAGEVVQPERVGSKQPVVAGVPHRRMAEVCRVIEAGDAHGAVIKGAREVEPGGRLAPGVGVALAVGVEVMARRYRPVLGLLQVEFRPHPQGHRALFRVAKHERAMAGRDCDGVVDDPVIDFG